MSRFIFTILLIDKPVFVIIIVPSRLLSFQNFLLCVLLDGYDLL